MRKNAPLKIWENMNEILKSNNITVAYNEITKDVEIEGLDSTNLDNQLVDIHSLCIKYGFKLPFATIDKFVNLIGELNPKNPVIDYLRECYMDFDGNYKYIQKLCDAIITSEDFNPKLKKILIIKWLLNTAMIPFNEGNSSIEGILTLQGRQGLRKTRLIKKLVPMYVKTGLELDPSDKDKVYQCIKYWGEVMHIKEENKVKHYLEAEELDLLNNSNEEFKIYNSIEISIDREFNWDIDRSHWQFKPSMEIASRLNVNSTKGIKTCLLSRGAQYTKRGTKRGYVTPPYKVPINF